MGPSKAANSGKHRVHIKLTQVSPVHQDARLSDRKRALTLDSSRPSIILGRASKNRGLEASGDNLWIDSPIITKEHARFMLGSSEAHPVILRDLHSTHGTFIGSRRIKSDHPLQDGEIITFGAEVSSGSLRYEPHIFMLEAEWQNIRYVPVEVSLLSRLTNGSQPPTPEASSPVSEASRFAVPENTDDSDDMPADLDSAADLDHGNVHSETRAESVKSRNSSVSRNFEVPYSDEEEDDEDEYEPSLGRPDIDESVLDEDEMDYESSSDDSDSSDIDGLESPSIADASIVSVASDSFSRGPSVDHGVTRTMAWYPGPLQQTIFGYNSLTALPPPPPPPPLPLPLPLPFVASAPPVITRNDGSGPKKSASFDLVDCIDVDVEFDDDDEVQEIPKSVFDAQRPIGLAPMKAQQSTQTQVHPEAQTQTQMQAPDSEDEDELSSVSDDDSDDDDSIAGENEDGLTAGGIISSAPMLDKPSHNIKINVPVGSTVSLSDIERDAKEAVVPPAADRLQPNVEKSFDAAKGRDPSPSDAAMAKPYVQAPLSWPPPASSINKPSPWDSTLGNNFGPIQQAMQQFFESLDTSQQTPVRYTEGPFSTHCVAPVVENTAEAAPEVSSKRSVTRQVSISDIINPDVAALDRRDLKRKAQDAGLVEPFPAVQTLPVIEAPLSGTSFDIDLSFDQPAAESRSERYVPTALRAFTPIIDESEYIPMAQQASDSAIFREAALHPIHQEICVPELSTKDDDESVISEQLDAVPKVTVEELPLHRDDSEKEHAVQASFAVNTTVGDSINVCEMPTPRVKVDSSEVREVQELEAEPPRKKQKTFEGTAVPVVQAQERSRQPRRGLRRLMGKLVPFMAGAAATATVIFGAAGVLVSTMPDELQRQARMEMGG